MSVKMAFVLGGALLLAMGGRVQMAAADESTAQLQLQSAALTSLDELHLSVEQLKQVQALAAGCADPTYIAPDESTGDHAYHDAALSLRNALANADEPAVAKAKADLDKAAAHGAGPAEADVSLSDAARNNAPGMVQILTTSQYARYIAIHAGEVPDAADLLIQGMDQCRQANDSQFVALRDRLTAEIVVLVFGIGPESHPNLVNRVNSLLTDARRMKTDQYEAERADLQSSARKIIAGHAARTDQELENWVDGRMARLLSNPELNAALARRIRALKAVS